MAVATLPPIWRYCERSERSAAVVARMAVVVTWLFVCFGRGVSVACFLPGCVSV